MQPFRAAPTTSTTSSIAISPSPFTSALLQLDGTAWPRAISITRTRSARKEFETFPERVKSICLAALTIAAEGGKADLAKPLQGIGSGIFELAVSFRGDAYRLVYAVQLADAISVIDAFRKKSTRGIKTTKRQTDLIKDRLKRLKEMLR